MCVCIFISTAVIRGAKLAADVLMMFLSLACGLSLCGSCGTLIKWHSFVGGMLECCHIDLDNDLIGQIPFCAGKPNIAIIKISGIEQPQRRDIGMSACLF